MKDELREEAKRYKDMCVKYLPDDHYDAFIAGATWQAKRMYTEEQVKEAIRIARLPMDHDETTNSYSRPSVDGIIQSLKQKQVMKGKLVLIEYKWCVEYQDLELDEFKYFPLYHISEFSLSLRSDKQPIDIIGEEVEFVLEEVVVTITGQVQSQARLTKCRGLSLSPKSDEYHITEDMKNSITDEDIWIPQHKRPEVQYTREDMIDFAKWIARDWFSMWVENKLMWEYENEVGTHHEYFGYFTDEQLFELYLKDKNK